MGLYDRDYLRDDEPRGFSMGGQRSVVLNLIIVNAAIFVIDLFTENALRKMFALSVNTIHEPWKLWQVLTYAFVHGDVMHLAFNMFALWTFGQPVEARYGPREFLRFYLTAAVFGGCVWLGLHQFEWGGNSVIGASGAVNAVVILFAFNYPNIMLQVMFILPMKAWVAAVLFVLLDMFGMDKQVAHDVHLAGAGFAATYYLLRWNLTSITAPQWLTRILSRRPKLRVVGEPEPRNLDARVDAILEKISQHGEQSLTKAERKTLEDASRRYQRQKRT